MIRIYKLTLLMLFVFCGVASAQEKFIHNLSKIPGSINPSFQAFKEKTRIGVLAEITSNSQGTQSQHKYGFASTYFEEYNFQLGLEVFNNKLENAGYNYNSGLLTYSYKLKLPNEWFFYPSITGGYSTYKYDFNNLTFQDQINIFTGQISATTIDPITATESIGYFDVGVSFIMHNDENMIFGLSAKHINMPKISSKLSENKVNLDMLISGQFGYEIDINKYAQNQLPDHSYLYLFNVVSMQGPNTRLNLYQDVILGNFTVGLNEHFTFLDAASFSEIGASASLILETFEFGLNYKLPFGKEAKLYVPNALELFLVFDISRFKDRGRKDYSRFYQ